MSIQVWRQRPDAISISEYMARELPESEIKGKCELTEPVTVTLVDSSNLVLYARVARCQGGYYSGTIYATPTGGALCGVYKVGKPNSKVGALTRVIRSALDNHYVTGHPGNMAKLEAALKNVSLLNHVQLTLF